MYVINSLVVGCHLLTRLEGIKVPLARSKVVVASFKTVGEGLGISFTSIARGLRGCLELLRLILRSCLILRLFGSSSRFRGRSAEEGRDTVGLQSSMLVYQVLNISTLIFLTHKSMSNS